jgi:bleomycin hydrolase
MRMLCAVLSLLLVLIGPTSLPAQQSQHKDRAVFVQQKNEFMDSLRAEATRFKGMTQKPDPAFRVDFTGIPHPESVSEFTRSWHTPPVPQALTNTCWCFSTTSFFESEVYRLSKKEVKLSEMYTVYWEYVEKARRFVQERGNSAFGEGSEANAVPRMWKKYGVVPESAYTGMLPGQKVHDHEALFAELNGYLASVKRNGDWNEEAVIATFRSILDHYLGRPPESIQVNGKTMTPAEYLANVLKLKLDDYVDIMSLMEKPFYRKVEYEVGDNWWHSKDYLNVSVDDFMAVLKKAVRNGYTLAIGGDTSEPGYEGHAGFAVVPSFDIPAAYIDDYARQFRFSNGTTGDDHGIHVVGYTEKDGVDWYLIKDSGSGSRNNLHPGYYFYREDYVRLKMIDFMVHKDMAAEILKKVAAN